MVAQALRADDLARSLATDWYAATAWPWAGIFRDLRASRRAELCGPCSVTAATRVVPLCSRQRSLPSVSLAGEPLPEQILGLAGRLDDLRVFTGCLVGPDYRRSLARRLARLQQLVKLPAEP